MVFRLDGSGLSKDAVGTFSGPLFVKIFIYSGGIDYIIYLYSTETVAGFLLKGLTRSLSG